LVEALSEYLLTFFFELTVNGYALILYTDITEITFYVVGTSMTNMKRELRVHFNISVAKPYYIPVTELLLRPELAIPTIPPTRVCNFPPVIQRVAKACQ